jgi:hypothetical protein
MSSKYVITNNYRLHVARQFIESVSEQANTAYYVFAAKHLPFSNSSIPQPYDTVKSMTTEVYNDMMYGKRVTSSDLKLVIDRHDWTSNTVYDVYDDTDINLSTKQFYAVVNAGAYFHVWKCLDNNMDGYSTVQPNFADIDAADEVYETSDRYRWKYMYTVSSSEVSKFATAEYFPITANSTVAENAVDGAIDFIKIEDAGQGYDNYLVGTFSNSDIKLNGNTLVYGISNSSASSVNDFYTDCVLYISAGTGSGQYKDVIQYVVNATTKYVVLQSSFTTVPTNSSEYEIYPKVRIYGDGTESNTAVGRAIINSTSNSVARVEMLSRGAGYKYIEANVLSSSVVGVISNAEVRAIYSPDGGHGSDAEKELYARRLCISVKFSNTESNTILATNDINQIGLMKDPIFSNVIIETATSNGTFSGGEKVYRITPKALKGTANVSITSSNVVALDADFENQFAVGEYIYISGNNQHQLAVVNSVVNATHLTITTNGFFSCSSANIYFPNTTSYGYVSAVSVGNVVLSNVVGVLSTNNILLGLNSGGQATINTVARSDKIKGFDTFIQMYTYRVQVTSGSFVANEVVYQSDISLANAYIHTAESLGSGFYKIYVTNQLGIFNVGEEMTGASSSATGTILDRYEPELRYNSGEIIYLENVETITRQATQSETFKLIFEF